MNITNLFFNFLYDYETFLPNISTNIIAQNPRITNTSWTNPGTFTLDFSLSRISKTATYNRVPAAIAYQIHT